MMGSHLIELLLGMGAKVYTVIHARPLPKDLKKNRNLITIKGDLTKWTACMTAVKGMDYIFHLAAYTGGLGLTASRPASVLYPNLAMDSQIFEAARRENVDRFLYGSCACIYPDGIEILEEENAWMGAPPTAHATYSWAKRMGELLAQSYAKEYKMKIAIVRPANSYGPRDNFDLATSHAIPALIRKAVEGQTPFVIWGKGETMRDFIYVKDAVKGMVIALEKYAVADPINLATGKGIKIKELACLVLKIVGRKPKIIFDTTKPEGQRMRILSTKKAFEKIKFRAETNLEDGIKETVAWYKQYA